MVAKILPLSPKQQYIRENDPNKCHNKACTKNEQEIYYSKLYRTLSQDDILDRIRILKAL